MFARLIACIAIAVGAVATVCGPAHAQDATWLASPGSANFDTGTNWSTGSVPIGTAFFDTSNTTNLSFSGNTTIGGWTFNAGASAFAFTNAQQLVFNGAGIVINGGSATITTSNLLTFAGSSTAGSANIINSGTIDFRNSSTAGSATIFTSNLTNFFDSSSAGNATITNSGGLNFEGGSTAGSANITNNNFINFEGASTAGSATITNSDSLAFNGTSTAGNATIINNTGGLIGFTNSSTAGNATITTNTGADLFFTDTSTGGQARIIVNAGGTFDMSGLTASGMTAGSIEGAGTFNLGSKLLTVGSNNLSTEVSGSVEGTGSLTKVGTGILTLSGANLYIGATTVDAGTLLVNGSIANSSALAVNAGGTVGGIGVLPSTTINGGTLSPGSGIGTITVQGNLAFVAPGLYLVDLSPTAADRTNVSGPATLAGSVQVVAASGTYTPGTTYTILNSVGGVSGTFAGATSNFTFLAPALSYDANNVYLTILRNGVSFASVGQTQNEIATGGAVDRLGPGNPIFDAVISGDAAQARAAFNLLSGEIHASAAGVILYDSRYVRDAIIGRLRQSYGSNGGPLTALAANGPVVAYAHGDTNRYALGYGDPEHSAGRTDAAPVHDGLAAWGQALGAWGNFDSNGNAATLDRSLGGIITGLDATFDGLWRLGVAGGYTQASLDVDTRNSSGSADNYHLALYGGGQFGALGVRTGAAYSWNDIETTRNVSFPGFSDLTRARYDADTAQLFGDLGYAMVLNAVAYEPYVGLAYVNVQSGGFTETGGAAALTAAGQSYDATFTTLGVRAATVLALLDCIETTAHGTLAWRHAFGDVTPQMALAFASNGVPFTIGGVPIAEDSLVVDAGLDANIAANTRLGVTYSGQLASGAQDHAVLGNFIMGF